MDNTLIYALAAGIALVILAVIAKATLRWIFKVFAFLIMLAALAVGSWLWFNYSGRQSETKAAVSPTRRASTTH